MATDGDKGPVSLPFLGFREWKGVLELAGGVLRAQVKGLLSDSLKGFYSKA